MMNTILPILVVWAAVGFALSVLITDEHGDWLSYEAPLWLLVLVLALCGPFWWACLLVAFITCYVLIPIRDDLRAYRKRLDAFCEQ